METQQEPEEDQVFAWTASGRRLHVDLADHRAHELVAADGDFCPQSTLLWQRVLDAHPWDLVVDVGVNYGEMVIGVELPPTARVVGFEPNPAVRALAARSLADNDVAVELRAEAVGAEVGTAAFAVDPDWSGLSSFAAPGAGTMEVPVTTLDAVVGDAPSYCVKVDVEGFEDDVLRGAARVLARDVPWAVMLEVKHMASAAVARLADEHHLLLLTAGGDGVRLVGAEDAEEVLASGEVYPQDAVLVSPAALPALRG